MAKKSQCDKCIGLCCRYFALPIETPEDKGDYDDIRWYLCHKDISVFVEEGDWYINIKNRCTHLSTKDNHCRIYSKRPRICRGYRHSDCDYVEGEYDYELHFTAQANGRVYKDKIRQQRNRKEKSEEKEEKEKEMKIPPVKGTRDFYPPDMTRRNWIIDGWKKVSVRNGFEEYDGPIFEYLKMFQIKSGDEIVDQLFSFKDRGGRDLALRPEITPTLARMVNQQINSLPKPIKWFSVPRLFRAERPQKGRLREFFQWNIDIIGADDVLADAEVIFTTVDYLRSVGLKHRDVRVKISSRKLLASSLKNVGIPETQLLSLYPLLDKYSKIPGDTFEKMLAEQVSDESIAKKVMDFMGTTTLSEVSEIIGTNAEVEDAVQELAHLKELLEQMGVWQYCDFYPSIVRGLAYYTDVVFEVHEFAQELRAICGGGRYDNLLHDFGGPRISATGMGMGDCVLGILLDERGLFKPESKELDYFVAFVDEVYRQNAIELTMKLRSAGFVTNFSYKAVKLSRQLKEASAQNAQKSIIIGEEFKDKKLVVKDMSTGKQELVNYDKFLSELKS